MKKTYNLVHAKIKAPRIVDSIKHDIKKNLKKERNQTLPSGFKFWEFDCKLGQTEETASQIPLLELTKSIDDLLENKAKTIYVEMLPKAVESLDK